MKLPSGLSSAGDQARQFSALRNTAAIKRSLDRLANELSTGRVSDVIDRLRGDGQRIGAIDRQIAAAGSFARSSAELSQRLGAMQLVLEQVDQTRSRQGTNLIGIKLETPIHLQQAASRAAAQGLTEMIAALNTGLAGQSLFSGDRSDRPPLADAATILQDLRLALSGATTTSDVIAVMDGWFDLPGGGFETLAYQGDPGPPLQRRVDRDVVIAIDGRADDPGIRDMLKAMAMAALADDGVLAFDDRTRAELLKEAGLRLVAGSDGLTAVRGRLGLVEEVVERSIVRHEAEESSLGQMRNAMIEADPFRTASELQAVRLQLETQYAVVARLSGLSLVGFLR
ncbi:MAG: hypothetical protein JJT81_09410 [Rubellimicrobium sp.]|nr:hypothetical protein [Rubellimicrobium sp.]